MKIIECPRDAMQGIEAFIPTDKKAEYINKLLKVGFDTIDVGSFVSPKAIPQMKDTGKVVERLDVDHSQSGLLAIVANKRGADTAAPFEEINYLGFPLSVSETFQQRNTRKSVAAAFGVVDEIQALCLKTGKRLVIYISMGFGNPYDEPYDVDSVSSFVEALVRKGIAIISLADTIGVADEKTITALFEGLTRQYPQVEFGAHFHSDPHTAYDKIKWAYRAGCRRLDGAIGGFGGCPMAKDDLVGNIATETILSCMADEGIDPKLDRDAFDRAVSASSVLFGHYR